MLRSMPCSIKQRGLLASLSIGLAPYTRVRYVRENKAIR